MVHEERGDHLHPGAEPTGADVGGREDGLNVRRAEEELGASVRKREAGSMNVRKSVRTEREQVLAPKRREEVEIERVPANWEVPGGEIGGDEEFVVRVFEEEVVISKRVVLKEEIRLRKRVVEEAEVVEVDLRKEEVEIDDQTERGGRDDDLRQGPPAPERR